MNASPLGRHYGALTPDERFRLILAARARGDDAERERLVNSARRITLTMADHAPYKHAFDELALLVYIELQEWAAFYLDALRYDEGDLAEGDNDKSEEHGDEAEPGDEGELPERGCPDTPPWRRTYALALAAGYVLRAKADAWKSFCERLGASPYSSWEGLPGFDRVQRALALTEWSAFRAGGFLRWLNARRPAGEPERTEVPLAAAKSADGLEETFRELVEWWGG